jgi:hypothetical protein
MCGADMGWAWPPRFVQAKSCGFLTIFQQQLTASDVQKVAALGFKTIFSYRPDLEGGPLQLLGAEIDMPPMNSDWLTSLIHCSQEA